MAGAVVQRVIGLGRYLQDPCLVARFQQLCGVRGTFPRKSPGTEEAPNGAFTRPGSGEQQGATDPRLRKTETPHDSLNGAAPGSAPTDTPDLPGEGESGAGDSRGPKGRVKPLRKNSLTGDVGQEFIIENKFLFYLFTIGTELGNEMFFIVFFPFLMWNVDAYVSRQVILVWVWVLFFGQSTKDLVGWTRPASPPVVKVEVFYIFEYSMPSVHAMTGTSVPFCLFLLTYDRWEVAILSDSV